MDTYAAILLWVIPGFMVLMSIEILYGHFTSNQTYSFMDTLSSLSSGMTNILKDSLSLVLIIVSYPYILESIAIVNLESSITLYLVAFICVDFASYWNHRLNHKVNIFWNRHVIHHSSEEFNLACALRQSISAWIGFGALFLIPAALFGVPANIISLLAPLHLFAQFWYHTQHIGKLGFLEYIIVTPSQHRVHHAINPIYIDKNMAAIFSVWDRLFGTFQEELDSEPPVYGTLKPSKSWNPIWINFQHLWQITQDAWYAKNWIDKLKIWFMPTGWRPKDVEDRFPITPRPIDSEDKYNPFYNNQWKAIALIHFVSLNFLLLFLLANYSELTVEFRVSLGFVLLFSIFGFTGLMDFHKWAPTYEIFRGLLGILFVFLPQCEFLRFEYPLFFGFYITYFIITSALGIWSNRKEFNRSLAL